MFRWLYIALLLTLTAASASAAGIYKWVDKNGKTHYGDRPPADAGQSKEVKIRDIPEADRQVPSNAERRARRNLLLDSFEEDRAEKKKAAAEEKERKTKLSQQCARAKHNLEVLRQATHLYGLDDSGNKVFRSDEAREKTTRDLESAIKKNCG